jgi:hypothetical protein
MARRGRPPKNGKRQVKSRPVRTRDHVIADLSILHFQWLVAKCGYVAEEPNRDYGYDLVLFTYTEAGEIENGSVLFQFKATDEFDKYLISEGKVISFPIERQHVELWRDEPLPVILVVYDVGREQAYWLYTQRYFKAESITLEEDQAAISLHIPIDNVVDAATIQTFRSFKQEVLRRIREVSLHDKGDIQSTDKSTNAPGV